MKHIQYAEVLFCTIFYLKKISIVNHKMSCCNNPYERVKTTWTPEGSLIQGNYVPTDGWPYNPSEKWPTGASRNAWSRVGNVNMDNTPDYASFPINQAPTLSLNEGFTGNSYRSASGFSTLQNTWKLPRPYSS